MKRLTRSIARARARRRGTEGLDRLEAGQGGGGAAVAQVEQFRLDGQGDRGRVAVVDREEAEFVAAPEGGGGGILPALVGDHQDRGVGGVVPHGGRADNFARQAEQARQGALDIVRGDDQQEVGAQALEGGDGGARGVVARATGIDGEGREDGHGRAAGDRQQRVDHRAAAGGEHRDAQGWGDRDGGQEGIDAVAGVLLGHREAVALDEAAHGGFFQRGQRGAQPGGNVVVGGFDRAGAGALRDEAADAFHELHEGDAGQGLPAIGDDDRFEDLPIAHACSLNLARALLGAGLRIVYGRALTSPRRLRTATLPCEGRVWAADISARRWRN
ncbi:MAG: hypothetical protein U0841_24160 [Chloroflexia bacterium]